MVAKQSRHLELEFTLVNVRNNRTVRTAGVCCCIFDWVTTSVHVRLEVPHLQSIAYTPYTCGAQRALRHEYS